MNVFMDKAMSTLMSMSILIGAFVLLYFAYRSNSDGKALIKKSIEKRNLFIEIILLFMGLIEGVNAATYAVKEGRDFGASIAMHVLGGIISGVFAFGIYKQVTDVALAVRDQKHPMIITKEFVDVVGTVILAIAFPIVNSYFVAIAAHHPRDFWNTLFFDWGRIASASVYYSTVLGMAHVFACFLLSLSSFDTTVFENTEENDDEEVVEVPLTPAPQASSDGANEPNAGSTDIIPYSRIPDRNHLINYVKTHFAKGSNARVDMDTFTRKILTDERYMDRIAVKVEDSLKARDKWDEEKSKLNSAQRDLQNKTAMLRSFTNAYNRNGQAGSRVETGLKDEITALETRISVSSTLADQLEDAYNLSLDQIGDLLDMI